MSARPVMVGLGELLWDLLPSGKVLGGAPANFAYMSEMLGNEGIIASRVGNDQLGWDARRVMEQRGMKSYYVQDDSLHGTGTASVLIDADGQPKFTIEESAAWDFLEMTPAWQELSARADVICFGSLAQRSLASAATIQRFLLNAPAKTLRICDANLREPFYTVDTLRRSLECSDVLKLNESELPRVASLLGFVGEYEEELATSLLRKFDLDLICVTKGARGSLLMSKTNSVRHSGITVQVTDAVGAGDAFTACVAHYYLRGYPLEQISRSANKFAAWVATQVGATPEISREVLQEILNLDDPCSTEKSA